MATLCSQNTCTSCMSCYNACPFDALTMVTGPAAEHYPSIDSTLCRDCGLCEKSCPIISPPVFRHPSKAIALYSRNAADVSTCSSGGAATLFSRSFIRKGGVVFGATARNGMPRFISIEDEAQLDMLKGSKYVFVSPEKIYREVRAKLKEGRECLFIGLPCNVAGLLRFLGRNFTNLTTVDLVCHGTPPVEYLVRHLKSKNIDIADVGSITFRGAMDFCTSVWGKDGSLLYSRNQYEDEYFAAFMRGLTYRPACYACRFARPERVSDITIGDFWGIAPDALDSYKGKKSLVLVNTPSGEKLMDSVKDEAVWQLRTVSEAINGNAQLRRPTPESDRAKLFREAYAVDDDISYAFKKSGVSTSVRKNRIRRMLLTLPKWIIKTIRK